MALIPQVLLGSALIYGGDHLLHPELRPVAITPVINWTAAKSSRPIIGPRTA
jgi:hypothetical protein